MYGGGGGLEPLIELIGSRERWVQCTVPRCLGDKRTYVTTPPSD